MLILCTFINEYTKAQESYFSILTTDLPNVSQSHTEEKWCYLYFMSTLFQTFPSNHFNTQMT